MNAVAETTSRNAQKFGAGALGRLAGLLHDLGKYDPDFLKRLEGQSVRHEHSSAGAVIALERYGPVGKILAFIIAGHHAGLADGTRGETNFLTPLDERLKTQERIKQAKAALIQAETEGLILPDTATLIATLPSIPSGFPAAFFTRMLFSCLVDADFLETERFYVKAGESITKRPQAHPSWANLLTPFNAHLEELEQKAKEKGNSLVTKLRAGVLVHARDKATLPSGLFTLTVPTGGGKTLTSLAFALDHAEHHNRDRIIYVIPFTSIIEQTAAVFRTALGKHAPAVLEHHSGFDATTLPIKNTQDEDADSTIKMQRVAAENWDAPIIVTTAVQFFESLFANQTSRCRKLHNIANSVIILDEAQTLPEPLLRPCIAALKELTARYGCSIVLCTATQPALNEPEFKGGFAIPPERELAPDVASLFTTLKRVQVSHAGILSDIQVAERIAREDQALCIVNTRAHAQALYEEVKDQPGARHLSTLMCAEHRQQVLAQIREDLREGSPCRVISTTLIEAGVDVNFPLVLRTEAGLDSIAQAAGRCNREGKRRAEESHVVVFAPADEKRALKSMRTYTDAGRALLETHSQEPFSPIAMGAYFREVYWRKGDGAFDTKGILAKIRDAKQFSFPFETISNDFRIIEDIYVPVIAPWGNARALVDELRRRTSLPQIIGVGDLLRKIQNYTVGIPRHARTLLLSKGAAEIIAEDRFADQFVWITNPSIYSQSTGLSWDEPTFMEAVSLIG